MKTQHTPIPVIIVGDRGEISKRETRSEPWTLGGGQTVVKVTGLSGGYSIDRVYVPLDVYHRMASRCEVLLEAAKYFKSEYERAMHSEFDYSNDPWSYERVGDTLMLKHAHTIDKAEGKP